MRSLWETVRAWVSLRASGEMPSGLDPYAGLPESLVPQGVLHVWEPERRGGWRWAMRHGGAEYGGRSFTFSGSFEAGRDCARRIGLTRVRIVRREPAEVASA